MVPGFEVRLEGGLHAGGLKENERTEIERERERGVRVSKARRERRAREKEGGGGHLAHLSAPFLGGLDRFPSFTDSH